MTILNKDITTEFEIDQLQSGFIDSDIKILTLTMEQQYHQILLELTKKDKDLYNSRAKAPKLFKSLMDFQNTIQYELHVARWKPSDNKYSCDGLCTW